MPLLMIKPLLLSLMSELAVISRHGRPYGLIRISSFLDPVQTLEGYE